MDPPAAPPVVYDHHGREQWRCAWCGLSGKFYEVFIVAHERRHRLQGGGAGGRQQGGGHDAQGGGAGGSQQGGGHDAQGGGPGGRRPLGAAGGGAPQPQVRAREAQGRGAWEEDQGGCAPERARGGRQHGDGGQRDVSTATVATATGTPPGRIADLT